MTIWMFIIGTMALSLSAATRLKPVYRRYHLWHSLPLLAGRQRP